MSLSTRAALVFGWFVDQAQLKEEEIQSIIDVCDEELSSREVGESLEEEPDSTEEDLEDETLGGEDGVSACLYFHLNDLCRQLKLNLEQCGSHTEEPAFAVGHTVLVARGNSGSTDSTKTLVVPPDVMERIKELGEILGFEEPPEWHLVVFYNN